MINLRFVGHLAALILFIFLAGYAGQFAGIPNSPWWSFPMFISSALCGVLTMVGYLSGLDKQ